MKNFLGCDLLELADDAMIRKVTGSPRGFAGAVGIKPRIIADYSLLGMADCVMGANREDFHLRHVKHGRDFLIADHADLRVVRESDPCPRCGAEIPLCTRYRSRPCLQIEGPSTARPCGPPISTARRS